MFYALANHIQELKLDQSVSQLAARIQMMTHHMSKDCETLPCPSDFQDTLFASLLFISIALPLCFLSDKIFLFIKLTLYQTNLTLIFLTFLTDSEGVARTICSELDFQHTTETTTIAMGIARPRATLAGGLTESGQFNLKNFIFLKVIRKVLDLYYLNVAI